ncbi:unnamed protein product [Moneuplotes crassus]|uniref:Uncharacterized protein n=1 Tax=Euplotes crassus TaxID=5936 RepID=A0AAD1UM17_EUPCR|nr:unnamed protein product [Moneuplotes crassus]
MKNTSIDQEKVREMMKYNLDDLFQDPHIFEWPPLVYEELQSDGWNHLTEAVVGPKYKSIKPFFKTRKIKLQRQLTLLNKRRRGFLLNHQNNEQRVLFDENVKKALETPSKPIVKRKKKSKIHKFNAPTFETAKARQNRFSIITLRKEFMEEVAKIENRQIGTKKKSVPLTNQIRRSERRGISQRISPQGHSPIFDMKKPIQNYPKNSQLQSSPLSEKKKQQKEMTDFDIGNEVKPALGDSLSPSSNQKTQKTHKKIPKASKFRLISNSSIITYKKAFLKSLKKMPTEKSRRRLNLGNSSNSKMLSKSKPDSMTIYGCYAEQSRGSTGTRNSTMLPKGSSGTTLPDTASPLAVHKRFARNNIRLKRLAY